MSTLAEQIAAVKLGLKRLRNSNMDPNDHICDAIATLEGMAAPGETPLQQANAEIRRLRDAILSARWRLTKGRALWNGPCHECDAALERGLTGGDIRGRASNLELAAIEAGDSPSPQQPTQEAAIERARRSAPEFVRMCRREDEPLDAIYRMAEEYLTDMLDRFAAQRVSAAPVSGDARKAIAKAISPQRWANLNAGEESSVLAEAERLLTAATDKARREALAEVEKWHWQRYIELRDESPCSREGLVSGIAGAHMAAHRESAEYFHTLTPQNPGDAEAQEGGKTDA